MEIRREGKVYKQRYERGETKTKLEQIGETKDRGTRVRFKPDGEIFADTELNFDILAQRMRELSFLNSGLRIDISDEISGKERSFRYQGGLVDFVAYLNKTKEALHPEIIYVSGNREEISVEAALQYNDTYVERIFTFANNINTREGGTHLVGFKGALTRTIKKYAEESKLPKADLEKLTGDDVREGLTAVISVKLPSHSLKGRPKASSATVMSNARWKLWSMKSCAPFLKRIRGSSRRFWQRCWMPPGLAKLRARPKSLPGVKVF